MICCELYLQAMALDSLSAFLCYAVAADRLILLIALISVWYFLPYMRAPASAQHLSPAHLPTINTPNTPSVSVSYTTINTPNTPISECLLYSPLTPIPPPWSLPRRGRSLPSLAPIASSHSPKSPKSQKSPKNKARRGSSGR